MLKPAEQLNCCIYAQMKSSEGDPNRRSYPLERLTRRFGEPREHESGANGWLNTPGVPLRERMDDKT